MCLAKGFLGELAFATGDPVKDIDDWINMFAEGEIGTHRFLCPTHQAVGRVDIKFEYVRDVGSNTTARKPADIWQCIGQAGEAIEVYKRRRPVDMAVEVKRLHCCAAGAEVDT